MVFKVINISDTGTATKHGGNDLDKVANQMNGTDVDSVKLPVDYVDFNIIAEPSSPSSGYVRVFMDTADSKLKMKRSNGDVVVIE